MGTVIQLVTAGLEERAKAGCLHGPSHAASALDGMTDASDFVFVTVRDGFLQCGQAFMQIGDHRRVDFANRRLGHELAELGDGGGIDDEFFCDGVLGLVDFGIVLTKELLEILRTEGLRAKSRPRRQ